MDQVRAAEVFRALGVPNRMRILTLLKTHGSLPVKTIAERLQLSSPAVSQHLKVLRHAGLVQARREGYFVPYEVDAHALSDCCGMLVSVCSCPHHRSQPLADHPSETQRLRHRRDLLLGELQRIEAELESLRGKEA